VDIHIVLERSQRMLEAFGGVSKWEFTRRGLSAFLSRISTPNSVGLQLFGRGGADSEVECDPFLYEAPVIEAAYDTHAAILEVLDATSPSGDAPMVPALEGALRHAEAVQRGTSNAQRVVLILAGAPNACEDTPESLRAMFASSSVTSYVIALGPDFDVGPVGQATETWPFVIDAAHPSSRLADALSHIALGATRRTCDYGRELPSTPPVIVEATRMFLGSEEIPHLDDAASCAASPNGGFYLDTTAAIPEYDFCPCSCASFTGCDSPETYFFCE
jgi:hypothetical protein